MSNASDLEIAWTTLCFILLLFSLINGFVTAYRGLHAKKQLIEDGMENEWADSGAQKIFWQRVLLSFLFIYKGAFFAIVGVLAMGNPPPSTDGQNHISSEVFAIGIILLCIFSIIYQAVIIIMRPALDQDIINTAARSAQRKVDNVQESSVNTVPIFTIVDTGTDSEGAE